MTKPPSYQLGKLYSPSRGQESQRVPFLKITDLSLHYQELNILKHLSLTIFQEEIVCLLGPSGCGKTTLLKAIAGFDSPTAGEIYLRDTLVSSPHQLVRPADRNITMLFQDLALFPHLTVEQNILLAMRKGRAKVQKDRLDTLVTALKLEHVVKKYPHTISGGEQQRTALARALAPKPPLILLDEPLSSQDIELKQKLQFSLKVLLKEEKITTLFVTHDQDEAFALSDKMGVLHNQRLEQYGTPYEVYYQPRSRFIADFIGKGTLVNGIIEEGILISEFGRIKKFQLVPATQASPQPSPKAPPQSSSQASSQPSSKAPPQSSSQASSQPSPKAPQQSFSQASSQPSSKVLAKTPTREASSSENSLTSSVQSSISANIENAKASSALSEERPERLFEGGAEESSGRWPKNGSNGANKSSNPHSEPFKRQSELTNSQSEPYKRQSELANSQSEPYKRQSELANSQSEPYKRQSELANSQSEPYKRQSLSVKVLVRPDDVQLDNRSAIRAQIIETIFQGSHFLYVLQLRSGTELLSLMPSIYRYNKGEEVGIAFSFQHIVVFA